MSEEPAPVEAAAPKPLAYWLGRAVRVMRAELEPTCTGEQLAERSGLSRTIVLKLERGGLENTTIETLEKIARAMGRSVADVIARAEIIRKQAASAAANDQRQEA